MKFRRQPARQPHNPGYHQNFELQQDPVTKLYRKCEITRNALSIDTNIHIQMTERQLIGMIMLMVIFAILFVVGVILDSYKSYAFAFNNTNTRNQSQ